LSWEGTAQGKIGSGSYSNSGVTSNVTGGTNLSVEFGIGTLANVKCEKGTKQTPFIQRSYAEELRDCMRYYQAFTVFGFASSTGTVRFAYPLPIKLRNNPTATLGTWYTGSGNSAPTGTSCSAFADWYYIIANGANALDVVYMNIKFDAEL
jgi:hypothetical protein